MLGNCGQIDNSAWLGSQQVVSTEPPRTADLAQAADQ
jgi:hypothetical protein